MRPKTKLKPGKTNREDRLNFVDFWAEFVRDNPDEVWSKQQKELIDPQMENAKSYPLSHKECLKIKGR